VNAVGQFGRDLEDLGLAGDRLHVLALRRVIQLRHLGADRIVVAAAVIETLDALNLRCPKVSEEKLKDLAAAKQILIRE